MNEKMETGESSTLSPVQVKLLNKKFGHEREELKKLLATLNSTIESAEERIPTDEIISATTSINKQLEEAPGKILSCIESLKTGISTEIAPLAGVLEELLQGVREMTEATAEERKKLALELRQTKAERETLEILKSDLEAQELERAEKISSLARQVLQAGEDDETIKNLVAGLVSTTEAQKKKGDELHENLLVIGKMVNGTRKETRVQQKYVKILAGALAVNVLLGLIGLFVR